MKEFHRDELMFSVQNASSSVLW